MNKAEFLNALRKALSGLPIDEVEQRVEFYTEMIDDRIEDGLSEEEAVLDIGSIDEIVDQITADIPLGKIVKERIKPKKKLSGWNITLIILGFPVWLPLLAAAFAVALAIYISVWAIIISLWSVFVAFIGCALGGLVGGASVAGQGEVWLGVADIGIAIASIGFSVFSFYGCKAISKGWVWLTKKMFIGLKKAFVKKEAV